MKEDFIHELSKGNASIKSRQTLTELVLSDKELLKYAVATATNVEDKFHYKAVWILEQLAELHCELLKPYYNKIIAVAPNYKHESAIRGISRTIHFISRSKKVSLTQKQENQIIALCFDWLINPKIRLAPKVFSIYTLECLSAKQHWIKKQLAEIIEKDAQNQRPGYKAAAKRVLKKINH
jgi:hypothetical protein